MHVVVLVGSTTNMQRQAEQKIKQQNDFLNLVLDSLKYPFIVIDPSNYTITLANSAARSSQLTKESTCYALTHERDKPCNSVEHPCPIEIIKKTKKPITLEHIHYDKDGNSIHVEVYAFPVLDSNGNVFQVIEYSIDITERKRVEKAFRESEEKYQELAESISDVFFAMDKNLRYTYWNKASEKLSGIPAKNAVGKTLTEVFPDNEAREQVKKMYLQVIETKKPKQLIVEYPGNEQIVHEINTYPTIEGVSVFIKDITERKQADQALQESEAKFRNLFQNHSAAKLIIDPDTGNIVEANRSAERFYGWSVEQLKEMRIQDINTLSGEQVKAEMEKARLLERTYFEFRHRLSDGSFKEVGVYSGKVDIKGKALLHSIIHDISDRKQTEEQRNRLISDLQKTLSEVKTLRGFLPICSHCKNIRDDKGYWSKIESYIHQHSDAEFSHGICPECAKKYYPEMDLYEDAE